MGNFIHKKQTYKYKNNNKQEVYKMIFKYK